MSPCFSSSSERSTPGRTHQPPPFGWPNLPSRPSWRAPGLLHLGSWYTSPVLVPRVGNKKLAHIAEGTNTITGIRRSISPNRHLDFWLQPAAGSSSILPVAPTWIMDSGNAPPSRSSACCGVFHWFLLVSHTNTRDNVFQPPRTKLVTFWAVSRAYPVQLNCSDSRLWARRYHLRRIPFLTSECVCQQCNSSFVITRESALPLAMDLPVNISNVTINTIGENVTS